MWSVEKKIFRKTKKINKEDTIIKARLIKGVGAKYTATADGKTYICTARGRTKKDNMFVVGDFVEITENPNVKDDYLIDKIHARNNRLKRPAIANIDNLVLVLSQKPRPDLFMIDKLIVYAYNKGIECIVCINKSDIIDKTFIEEIKAQYEPVVKSVLVVSAQTGDGVNALTKELKGSLSAFAGQSGVGKSTLLNNLCPQIEAETGTLNRKSKRGNNTTRHTEIFAMDDNSFIADTPGFMVFDLDGVEPDNLHRFYPEFEEYREGCKYRACYHHNIEEKDCAVKRAVTNGKISSRRYNRYVELYKQIGGKKNEKKSS